MNYLVVGIDTAGRIALSRDTARGALKKANELINDGCWDVAIYTPEGKVFASSEFNMFDV